MIFIVERTCSGTPEWSEAFKAAKNHPELFPFKIQVNVSKNGVCRLCGERDYKANDSGVKRVAKRFGFSAEDGRPRRVCMSMGHFDV